VPSPEPVATDEVELREIFQEFREGLKEQLGEEDFETHYNLGIAYKEMGLMQEALGEFELSEKSEVRKLDSISMIALCFRDMGRDEDAVVKLQEGLELSLQGSDEQKGFLYDLADLYSKVGHEGESVEMFIRLHALDPVYRDVGKRAHMVQGQAETSPTAKKSGAGSVRNKKSRVSYL
jgi:tetratricopeptide (TPR) repeat protein